MKMKKLLKSKKTGKGNRDYLDWNNNYFGDYNMEIIWVDYGIASVHSDHIEINKNLKKYPQLLDVVLKHEKEHIKSNKIMDFWVDFKDMFNFRKQLRLIRFTLRHPKALTEMLPAYINHKKALTINYYLVIIYAALLLVTLL